MERGANLMRDLGIILLGVIIALILVKTGALGTLLTSTLELKSIGSLIAGIFFVSVFTAAPATIVLAEIAKANSIIFVAFFGGLGAMVGDFIIFRFMRDRLSEDFMHLVKKSGLERWGSIFKLKLFRWFLPLLGAVIIASPLPDELGLMMLGFSKIKTYPFFLLSFGLNFLGILFIAFVVRKFL
jgi:hypothetical protein